MKLESILEGISSITTSLSKNDRVTGGTKQDIPRQAQTTTDPGKQLLLNKATTDFMWVNSDSMSGAGIFNGDMVIVDRSLIASSGKIVIALLNGEMLIRRFEKVLNKIRLVPESEMLAPIDIDANYEAFSVCGVVTHIIRPLH